MISHVPSNETVVLGPTVPSAGPCADKRKREDRKREAETGGRAGTQSSVAGVHEFSSMTTKDRCGNKTGVYHDLVLV